MIARTQLTAVILSALLLAACGRAAEVPDAEALGEPETPPTSPPLQAAATESQPTSGRDLATLNVCELVTPDEVAGLAGGTAYPDPNQSSDSMFSMCWYELDATDGSYEYYIVYVEAADLAETVIDIEGPAIGDSVPGLGDEAYVRYVDSESQFRLVVVSGEIGLDLAGSRAEILQQIAALILERLD